MALRITNRSWILLALFAVVAMIAVLLRPTTSSALPNYASATGQPCATCHINPAGGGARTATGQAFEAIPTHATDPAGAFASLSKPAAPAPAAVAPSGPISVVIAGAASGSSITYAIVVSNSGDKDVLNLYLAGSIPAGATFGKVIATPISAGKPAGDPIGVDAGFLSSNGGSAAWLLSAVPAKASVGPFVYTVNAQSAADLSAIAFVHWTSPSDATALSAKIVPLTNVERVNVDAEIINELNNLDRTTTLWNIQPGLGTVMIEYATRYANMWFAAQANNWDMVRYQVGEMREIQETGENTRPSRAPSLKNFESKFLDPLQAAAEAKDPAAFTVAYDNAATGCNACHAGSSKAGEYDSFKFVKIGRPTAPVLTDVQWQGQ